VTPITIATNTAGPAITTGTGRRAIVITPDGKTAYLASNRANTVTPITVATNTPGKPIKVGEEPESVALVP
jgi:YVTN family beta-propeller protein